MTRINISISDEIIDKLNKYCGLVYTTRSGFIVKALENYFPDIEKKILEQKKKEAIEGILKIREEIGINLKGWDSTSEIRKLRDTRWVKNKRWSDSNTKKKKIK
jgi:metal-responsive CopG/Arc/MetJ family transcriptional regulator